MLTDHQNNDIIYPKNAANLFFGFTEVLFDGEDKDGAYFKLMKTI